MRFAMGQTVMLVLNNSERGEVIARCEYAHSEPQYLVRYLAADGRTVEAWWAESALEPFYAAPARVI